MSKKKWGPMTAAELMKQLEADPEYQARWREKERAWAQQRRFLEKAEAPLVRELRKVGCQVDSVWDLVNTREPYLEAIDVLLEHLEKGEYPARIRDGIARALAVRVLEPEEWEILLRCFRREDDEQARCALALALKANARAEHRDTLLELVSDPANGLARSNLADALYRSFRDEEVDGLLTSLTTDPQIGEGIKHLLKTGSTVVR